MCECECSHEGLCLLREYYKVDEDCRFMDDNGFCTAKESDLVEVCPDCDKLMDDCDCGTNLIIVKDSEGKMSMVTPKRLKELKSVEAKNTK